MKLREIRTKKNISQKELASTLNVNSNNISRYETGEREPNLKTLRKLAKALDCTIDELVEEDTEISD